MTIFRLLAFLLFLPAAAWAGYLPPPGPVAAPNCTGGNSVLGYTTPGTALNCGTGVSSGSIGNGTPPNVGVYSGTNTISDSGTALSTLAPLASPTFTGTPAAPTPATADNTTKLATTAYVKAQGYLIGNQSIALGGDLSGSGTTSISGTVTGLQGRSLLSTAPTTHNNVAWNGAAWAPGAATGASAGTYTCATVTVDASGYITSVASGSCSGGGTNYLLIATGSSFLIQTGSHLLIQ